MFSRKLMILLVMFVLLAALIPASVAFAKKPVTEVTNNLSFPVIAVDGFAITPLASPSFTVPYAGVFPGLTADEIAALLATGPWYAQKTTGNVWQADFAIQGNESVTYINWGDNIESLNPRVRKTFRLEVTLFKALETSMIGYTMAVLEYPSSASELQGTNTSTYESNWATVVSAKPRLVIQYYGTAIPTDLAWDGTKWVSSTVIGDVIPVSFAPELNVGGKYIFGASAGGWKPTKTGYHRITFYIPAGSGIDLSTAYIGEIPTTQVATAYVDALNNLTYVDVLVK